MDEKEIIMRALTHTLKGVINAKSYDIYIKGRTIHILGVIDGEKQGRTNPEIVLKRIKQLILDTFGSHVAWRYGAMSMEPRFIGTYGRGWDTVNAYILKMTWRFSINNHPVTVNVAYNYLIPDTPRAA